jgi:Na+/proline symporter
MTASFSHGDIASIVIYFVIILSIAVYHMHKSRGHQKAQRYFLADRSAPWWAVGCSLFASNIGSEHFVGLAGSGAKV